MTRIFVGKCRAEKDGDPPDFIRFKRCRLFIDPESIFDYSNLIFSLAPFQIRIFEHHVTEKRDEKK